jgi:hypothetical protein
MGRRGNAMIARHALVTTLFCSLASLIWLVALLPFR